MINELLGIAQQVPRGPVRASGDSLLRVQDTIAGAAGAVHDTLRAPPLPTGVAYIVRLIFGVPRWIQIGGAVLAAVVGIVVLTLLVRHRRQIITWLRTRARGVQYAMAGTVLVLIALAGFGGAKSWHYMQHDNGFCTGCHVMERPFGRFETFAGKHQDRKCHDCHQQSLYASTRQLVLWVANRPADIGRHAPVPNARCEGCHQLAGGKKPWEHALWLAGHKTHFESDSSQLKELLCVKCHGAEIHKFLPSTRTCQQSGCHVNQSVKLARMAKLPEISCVTCHAFTADLPALASHDSAKHALIPTGKQCLSCHQMKDRPPGYVAAKDPHKTLCGGCHDVHKDTVPADARRSCQRCHTDLARSAFHTGVNHRRIQTQCMVCHQPHAASVDASDCVGCHAAVKKRGQFKPPLPFDTNAVLKKVPGAQGPEAQGPEPRAPDRGLGEYHRAPGPNVPFEALGSGPWASVDSLPLSRDAPVAFHPATADTFPHSRHVSLPCLTCHTVNKSNTPYGLVFAIPRGCDLCHHQNVMGGRVEARDCERCHRAADRVTPKPTVVQVNMPALAPAGRPVGFAHSRHERLDCVSCHQAPDVVPPDSVRRCTACHAQHHEAARNCLACHSRAETPAAHSRTTHTGCDACHTPTRIAVLTPNRNFCVTCHAAQQSHQPGRDCATCHFLTTAEAFRPRLLRGGAN